MDTPRCSAAAAEDREFTGPGRAYSDGRPNRRWRRCHHGATERVWTRPKMQALSWTVRRNVVRCTRVSGLSIAAFHLPRARMEMRGSGPNRLRELESSPFEYRFSRSRLVDRLPLHCPPTCLRSRRYPFACRSGGRRWLPVDLPVPRSRVLLDTRLIHDSWRKGCRDERTKARGGFGGGCP